jgi:cell division protein FtsA
VLEEDEKELGVCLVDIGGGTSDIAVFLNGSIHHTAVIPIAGDQVTNDIAIGVRTPTKDAERIKIKHGSALQKLLEQEEFVDVPGVGEREPRSLSNYVLASVIEPRYAELFSLVLHELQRSGYEERIGAGIVLTGGTSKMKGAIELAEEIFHMPVRLGMPRDIGGLRGEVENPIHSTGVGLLLYGIAQQAYGERRSGINHSVPVSSPESLWERIKGWFNGNL